jgi:hypothetical protein
VRDSNASAGRAFTRGPEGWVPARVGLRLLAGTWLLGAGVLLSSCFPLGGLPIGEMVENSAALVPSSPTDASAPADDLVAARGSFDAESDHQAGFLIGRLSGGGDYDLYELGPSLSGDRWSVTNRSLLTGGQFVLALFDENLDLLARSASAIPSLTVILRHDCATVYIGVATKLGGLGGSYNFYVSRTIGGQVPAPQPQRVWLNFTGVSNLSINKYDGLSFGPFSGSMVGEQFADATDEIKQLIVDTLLDNYADYNVTILTSDTTTQPPEPYTTIHFGGRGDAQLGVADNVDGYNADPRQNAVVFVEALAEYENMALTVPRLGTMIGNIASHELGHLLGLHHVQDGHHVMNRAESGTIWDMTAPQHFDLAELDPDVFPVGQLNAPRLLEETVGRRGE